MNQETYLGVPTLSLFPLNTTKFKVIDKLSITIPRKGNYYTLSPEVFAEEQGDFDLLSNNIIYLPSITKILLATGKYPQLAGNQIFTPLSIQFGEETVIINGSILEILSVSGDL